MRIKKAKFPKVVRVGQTKATIYLTPTNGCDAYTVVWYEGAERKRKSFGDLGLAEVHASAQVNNLSKGETRAAKLSGEECLEYVRARNTIEGYALSLDTAMAEYIEAKRILKGGSLVEAARYVVEKQVLNIVEKPAKDVLDEMIKAKRNEGCSERYIQDLESRCGKFVEEFPRAIATIGGLEIKSWLQELTREGSKKDKRAPRKPVTNRTRNNFRLCIQTLFSFAKGERYLPKDWNEMEVVPLWKVKDEEVEIFTPEEMSILLSHAPDNLIPFLTIGAFAGLRSAEIERLDWSKVDLENGYITVDASIAKTNSRRLVPIVLNLKLWLQDHKKTNGPVLELANVVNAVKRLVNATRPVDPENPEKLLAPRVPWRHNALRHSFCSYRLADVKSAAQVALEAGNSPQMIFQHYRELVTEKGAKAWFEITPESTKAMRERAEREQQMKIVPHPALAAA
jgi:integrase